MSDYGWERNGDEFTFTWRAAGIGVGVNQLHESRGELYGEIWVTSSLPDTPPHVSWGRHNFSSIAAREKLAVALQKRIKEPPWLKMLESVCTRTALEWRRGEPIIDLATAGAPMPNKFLVSKLLPAGATTILYGDASSCKSLLALMVGVAVVTGRDLPNGLHGNGQGPVLCRGWGSDIDDQKERIRALTLGLQLEDLPHIHYRRQSRSITDEQAQLKTEIARLGAKMVVIDSLGPAVGASLRDEEEAIPAMNAIRNLGTTALALAHITKADVRGENGHVMPLGSIMFRNLARSTWEVRKADAVSQDITIVGIYHRKMNRGPLTRDPLGFEFTFYTENDATGMIEVRRAEIADDEDLAEYAPLHYRLRVLLASGSRSVEDLAKATKAKESTIGRTLQRMGDEVILLSGGKGRSGVSVWGLKSVHAN